MNHPPPLELIELRVLCFLFLSFPPLGQRVLAQVSHKQSLPIWPVRTLTGTNCLCDDSRCCCSTVKTRIIFQLLYMRERLLRTGMIDVFINFAPFGSSRGIGIVEKRPPALTILKYASSISSGFLTSSARPCSAANKGAKTHLLYVSLYTLGCCSLHERKSNDYNVQAAQYCSTSLRNQI